MQNGCVLWLQNTKTGWISYGCQGAEPWLIDKEISRIEEVDTLDEAVKRPILDESRAIVWCEEMTRLNPHRRYKVLHPQK
jgi:hypothetical protein